MERFFVSLLPYPEPDHVRTCLMCSSSSDVARSPLCRLPNHASIHRKAETYCRQHIFIKDKEVKGKSLLEVRRQGLLRQSPYLWWENLKTAELYPYPFTSLRKKGEVEGLLYEMRARAASTAELIGRILDSYIARTEVGWSYLTAEEDP